MTGAPTLIGSGYNNITAMTAASTAYYIILGMAGTMNGNFGNTSEAGAQITHRAAATVSYLSMYVGTNSRATNSTLRSRKNTANGNLSVSITALTTGLFQDTSNSDTIASGDLYCASFTTGTGTSAFGWYTCFAKLVSSGSNPVAYYYLHTDGPASMTVNSQLTSIPLAGMTGFAFNTSDVPVRVHVRGAGVLSHVFFNITANTRITSTTFGVLKNGSAGSGTVSVGAGATGNFVDTTNSDSFSNSDNGSYYCLTSTGGGSISVRMVGAMFTGTGNDFDVTLAREGTLQILAGTTFYGPLFGRMNSLTTSTTEAVAQIAMPFDGRASHLRMYFALNNTSTTTLKVRKNGSDGNQAVSVAAGGSGFVEDVSNHDDFVLGDLLCYTKGSAGATSNTFNTISMMISPPPSVSSGAGGGLIQVVT